MFLFFLIWGWLLKLCGYVCELCVFLVGIYVWNLKWVEKLESRINEMVINSLLIIMLWLFFICGNLFFCKIGGCLKKNYWFFLENLYLGIFLYFSDNF